MLTASGTSCCPEPRHRNAPPAPPDARPHASSAASTYGRLPGEHFHHHGPAADIAGGTRRWSYRRARCSRPPGSDRDRPDSSDRQTPRNAPASSSGRRQGPHLAVPPGCACAYPWALPRHCRRARPTLGGLDQRPGYRRVITVWPEAPRLNGSVRIARLGRCGTFSGQRRGVQPGSGRNTRRSPHAWSRQAAGNDQLDGGMRPQIVAMSADHRIPSVPPGGCESRGTSTPCGPGPRSASLAA